MDLNRERRLLELFEVALELAPAERQAYLLRSAEDPELAVEVQHLLEEQAGADLPELEVPTDLLDRVDQSLGGSIEIPGFQLLGVLGTGGMGRVFEAEQSEPSRKVALKTLRNGVHSSEALRRFAFEAEILARLKHPGIAQVYAFGHYTSADLGGAQEVPYFAMEFVEGARDLLAYAKAEGLTLAERLALFTDVCTAVQHGHDRGVLHRDLKPSNLLVDKDGRSKVIDFGIARPVESGLDSVESDHPRTVTGALYGTPSFLSPEQLLGESDLDVRTDVYALGCVLFRLTCGSPPHDLEGLGLAAASRMIAEQEPRRPTRLSSEVDRDLEAVLLKAVARRREDRFASAGALADDIRRYLKCQPVQSRPPSAWHTTHLWIQRHRALAAACLLALLAVVVGSTSSTVFAIRSAKDAATARNAELEQQRAARQAVTAAKEAEQARQSLGHLSSTFAFDFADRLARIPGAMTWRAELLAEAVDHLESIEPLLSGDLDMGYNLARAYMKLGDVQGGTVEGSLGDLAGRDSALERATALIEKLREQHPEDPRLVDFRISLHQRRGRALLDEQRTDAATAEFELALDLAESRPRRGSFDVEAVEDLSRSLSSLGASRGVSGDHAGALAAFEQSVRFREQLVAAAPGDLNRRELLGHGLAQVGAAHTGLGSLEEGREFYRRSLAEFDALEVEFPELDVGARGGIQARLSFASVAYASLDGDLLEALSLAGLERCSGLRTFEPDDTHLLRLEANLLYNLGAANTLKAEEASGLPRSELIARSIEYYEDTLHAFEDLDARGALLGRESHVFEQLDTRLSEARAELDGSANAAEQAAGQEPVTPGGD